MMVGYMGGYAIPAVPGLGVGANWESQFLQQYLQQYLQQIPQYVQYAQNITNNLPPPSAPKPFAKIPEEFSWLRSRIEEVLWR